MGTCACKEAAPIIKHGDLDPLLSPSTEHLPLYVEPETHAASPDNNITKYLDEVAPTQFGNQNEQRSRRNCITVNTDYKAIPPTRISAKHLSDTCQNETTKEILSQRAESSTRISIDNSAVHVQYLIEDDHYDVIDDSHLHEVKDSELNRTDETSFHVSDDSKVKKLNTNHSTENSIAVSKGRGETESRERQRCKDYEDMVKVFKPLIVKNLIVHDILPHLTFIEDEGRILAAEQRSPQLAVMYLLEEIEKSKNVRKWEKFMAALEKSGYEYIVQNIRGTHAIDNTYQVYYLLTLRAKLSIMIIPRAILPRLCAEGIITENTRQEIEQEETNRGSISAALLLLDRIPRKDTYWYRKFVKVLREENMNEVADNLDIPEVMNCTNKSFRPTIKPPFINQSQPTNQVSVRTSECNPRRLSEASPNVESDPIPLSPSYATGPNTTTNKCPPDQPNPPAVGVIATHHSKRTDHFAENTTHKNKSSSEISVNESVTNNSSGCIRSVDEFHDEVKELHVETEICEELHAIGLPVSPPCLIKGTVPSLHVVKHGQDEIQTLRNDIRQIKSETDRLKEETELLRQKCLIKKERAKLIRTKSDLQKELEDTETESQSLEQSLLKPPSSKEVHEADSLEVDDVLDKLYNTNTNRTFSVVPGSFQRTSFCSEGIRRRPSINDWRRSTMRDIAEGLTSTLFQQEFDILDSPLEPTETIKLFDFSAPKMTFNPAFFNVG